MRVLLTGAAGFIGYHTAEALLARGDEVVGLDNLNAYYDVALKRARLDRLERHAGFRFEKLGLEDSGGIERLFADQRPDRVVHLGAQAGVRHSIENPLVYAEANLTGFLNILEGCRATASAHLVYASSSSVYGANSKLPFSEDDAVDHPVSLYAATKKSNEVMAHAYAHLYRLPVTGLRFFTVYGPWGRPDMALFKFTRAMLAGEPIDVFNHGRHARDLTYVDDVVAVIVRALDRPAAPDPAWDSMAPRPSASNSPYRIYNIGNNTPVQLMRLIAVLEDALGVKAKMNLLPKQPGDVDITFADIAHTAAELSYTPATPIETGVGAFVAWYRSFYNV